MEDVKILTQKEIAELIKSLNENEKEQFVGALQNYKRLKEKLYFAKTKKEKSYIEMGLKASETAFKELGLVSAPIGGYRAMFRLGGTILGIVAKSALKSLIL